jgi:hypothetical protein
MHQEPLVDFNEWIIWHFVAFSQLCPTTLKGALSRPDGGSGLATRGGVVIQPECIAPGKGLQKAVSRNGVSLECESTLSS